MAIKSPKGASVYWYYLIVFKLPTTMQYKKEKNFRHQIAGAHKQERATSMRSCYGVFTDQIIFATVLARIMNIF